MQLLSAIERQSVSLSLWARISGTIAVLELEACLSISEVVRALMFLILWIPMNLLGHAVSFAEGSFARP